MEIRRLLLVCLGGAVGSGLRYLTAVALAPKASGGFPASTLTVNVFGCFFLELLLAVATGSTRLSLETRLLLGTGLLGGFTTYSTFNTETLALFRQGSPGLAIAYVSATLLVSLAAGVMGAWAGRGLSLALGQG
jgi:CrcB protein